MNDTIFAPATAPGRAAVAVVRISGSASGPVLDRLTAGRRPSPRFASLRRLRGLEAELLDEALVLWMPGPQSFTGEDQAELHLHGGAATVGAVLEALTGMGLRFAEPGEFTRRAFEAGKLELSQAEAIADLVDAETKAQRRQALEQLGGALHRRHHEWRAALIEISALLAAEIDFPDEEGAPDTVAATVSPLMERLAGQLEGASADMRGQRIRDGYRIAIVGKPNAGKSSLLNALVGKDAAIVTAIPGTTRDVIEVSLVLDGYQVLLADTAGIRDSADVIEGEGVRRALAWAESADLRLWVVDRTCPGKDEEAYVAGRPTDLLVLSKSDLDSEGRQAPRPHLFALEVSALTGKGLDDLRQWLTARVAADLAGADFPQATRLRHRELLSQAAGDLRRAKDAMIQGAEQAAEDVRLASRTLERISGTVGVEDVLDGVFSAFCIGK